ncbi:MAG: GNAT family N-acetyltransferase [Dichotomicrobium sp.]
MGDSEQLKVEVAGAMADVPAADWDACANPDPAVYNPFLSHAFLKALEDSGCVRAETGWAPHHLLLRDESGALLGAMPLYLKGHSMGEYVFDYAWADAYERAGGQYYPKLQSSVPFTPVPGRRLLVPGAGAPGWRGEALLGAAVELASKTGLSSLHLTFVTEEEWQYGGWLGLLQRTGQQFHWMNHGYASFEDFLAALASRKRKAVRRERREAVAAGIDIEWLVGDEISESHWDRFYEFYLDTGSRKWGQPYLNREFFSRVHAAMPERVALCVARRDGRYIAGALNFIGGDALYGRYWGAVEHHPFLHFEVCYYQAIELAIARGLARVEAGAQGEHKLARGYVPQTTYSLHYLAHSGLADAVEQFLEREREMVARDTAMLSEETPFKRCGTGTAGENGGGSGGGA